MAAMNIGVVGIDFSKLDPKSADRCMKLTPGAFKPETLNAVVLKTCHRLEIFFSTQEEVDTVNILHHLQQLLGSGQSDLVYTFFGQDCFLHLAEVVSGINSRIFGEDEILRQVKVAYERDKKACKLDFALHFLFQKCLKIGKNVRSWLGPRQRSPGLAAAIFSIVQTHIKDLKTAKVLFVGNSMINRRVYGFFNYRASMSMEIATSRPNKESRLPLIAFSDEVFSSGYDVIIAASTAAGPLIDHRHVDKLKKKTVLIDLGVPCNIEPSLAEAFDLYTLEQVEKRQMNVPNQEQTAEVIKTLLKGLVKRYSLIYSDKMERKAQRAAML